MTNGVQYFSDFQLGEFFTVFLKSNESLEGHFTGFAYTENMATESETIPSVIAQEGPSGIFLDDRPIRFSDISHISY